MLTFSILEELLSMPILFNLFIQKGLEKIVI